MVGINLGLGLIRRISVGIGELVAIVGGWFTITDGTHIASNGLDVMSFSVSAFTPSELREQIFTFGISAYTPNEVKELYSFSLSVVGE